MKNILLGITLLVLIGGGVYYFAGKASKPKDVHYHAGFVVYVDGVKQDYTDDQYMYYDICSVQDKIKKGTATKLEIIHLHENVGDVAHIHEKGATLGLLFENIGIHFPSDKTIVGYKNGQETPDIMKQGIEPYESVIIVVGDGTGVDLTKYVSGEHIRQVETNSKYCGK